MSNIWPIYGARCCWTPIEHSGRIPDLCSERPAGRFLLRLVAPTTMETAVTGDFKARLASLASRRAAHEADAAVQNDAREQRVQVEQAARRTSMQQFEQLIPATMAPVVSAAREALATQGYQIRPEPCSPQQPDEPTPLAYRLFSTQGQSLPQTVLKFQFADPTSVLVTAGGTPAVALQFGGASRGSIKIDLRDFGTEHAEALFEAYCEHMLAPTAPDKSH